MSTYINNFVEWAEEAIIPIKDLIVNNYDNPIMWIIILGLAVFLFAFTYDALNTNK